MNPSIVIPDGAMLPSALASLSSIPTANIFTPLNRPNSSASYSNLTDASNDDSDARTQVDQPSAFTAYHQFLVSDFLVIVGCIFAAIALLAACLALVRRVRMAYSTATKAKVEARFEREQTRLAQRLAGVHAIQQS